MSASECQLFGCLRGNWLQNFQFESPKMKLHEFVRVPTVSNWAKLAVQISKDEAPTPLLTVGLLFIFGHLSRVHLTTSKIHSISQTSLNFKQRTSPEVVNNSRKVLQVSHSYLHKLKCWYGVSASQPLAGSRGFHGTAKERAVWGQVG